VHFTDVVAGSHRDLVQDAGVQEELLNLKRLTSQHLFGQVVGELLSPAV
jgi:hypothetical protein